MAKKSALWSYSIAGWSGFYVMLVELLSGRLIAPSFGSSIYVWGSVIFVFMLGLAIGYLLGGIYCERAEHRADAIVRHFDSGFHVRCRA